MEFKWKSWSEAGIDLFRQAGKNVAFGDSEVTVGLGTQPPLHKHKHLESHRTRLKSQCGREWKLRDAPSLLLGYSSHFAGVFIPKHSHESHRVQGWDSRSCS